LPTSSTLSSDPPSSPHRRPALATWACLWL
jgi:hypothetical protein